MKSERLRLVTGLSRRYLAGPPDYQRNLYPAIIQVTLAALKYAATVEEPHWDWRALVSLHWDVLPNELEQLMSPRAAFIWED